MTCGKGKPGEGRVKKTALRHGPSAAPCLRGHGLVVGKAPSDGVRRRQAGHSVKVRPGVLGLELVAHDRTRGELRRGARIPVTPLTAICSRVTATYSHFCLEVSTRIRSGAGFYHSHLTIRWVSGWQGNAKALCRRNN